MYTLGMRDSVAGNKGMTCLLVLVKTDCGGLTC